MQYFSNPNVGSTLQIDDFCPAALYYSNRRCVSATSDLTAPNGNGEYLGVDSRCFQSNLVKVASLFGSSASSTSGSGSGNKPAAESGRCFQALCNADGTLSVIVELRELRCPLDGSAGAADTSPLAGFTGAILCPPARRFCPATATAMPVLTARPAAAASSSTGDQVGFRGPVAAACAARAQCASRKLRLLPACREFAFAVTRCFGTDCEEEMVAWLVGAGARGNCSSDGARAAFGRYCEEGRQGVQDVCNLAGAGRLAWAAAAVLLAVLTTMML